MKIRKNQIRDKCQSDKYYASIKYMAHSLRGKDRENFIITVCDLNIYLGCICALTCEKNATVEEYIWKTLNNYFQPRKIKFYDKSSGIWKENIKKLNSKDITYYLLACNVMGNMKAIKWYIYNHEVDKAIIIQLAKNMNEEQLVDLIYTLYRSSQNWDKIRGIGSTKSLFLYKNDSRIKKILSGLWYKDRDAFIQLAYDTGWLGDLGKKARKGNRIFIECLVGANKLLLTIELIEEVLCDLESDESSYDTLLKLVLKEKGERKQFAYILYIQKINNGYIMKAKDYVILKGLGKPSQKIVNYFIPFFLDLVNGDFRTNINLFELGDALSNVIVKPNKITPKVGYARNKNLNLALKTTKNIDLKKVLFFYFNTTMSVKASLDELFRLLNMYHDVQPGELIRKLQSFPIWVKATGIEQGKSNNITTENYLKIEPQIEVGNVILMSIVDYDYVLKEFVVKPYTGSIS